MKDNNWNAHISEDGREQTVTEHCLGTSGLAIDFANEFGAGEYIRAAALEHDCGKQTMEFQRRLGGGPKVDHSTAGAYELYKKNKAYYWASCLIIGHHGGMLDVGNRWDKEGINSVYGRLDKARNGRIPSYMPLPFDIGTIPALPESTEDGYMFSMWLRFLFSCLVDADFKDTEQFMLGDAINRSLGKPLQQLELLLDKRLSDFRDDHRTTHAVDTYRADMLNDCLAHVKDPCGLFSMTIPTGGGKTNDAISFALKHAVCHGLSRIIFVVPYMSIIEQTVKDLSKTFGTENVLAHYSGAVYDNDDEISCKKRIATEDWDAPIIVTSAVQFFESMYSNRPSKCRKLHNIARSVVIFDEAQMMPTRHLLPCVAAMCSLVKLFGCSVILSTATLPVLDDYIEEFLPGVHPIELNGDVEGMYEKFQRADIVYSGATLSEEDLADRLVKHRQVLCVVNTKKTAQEVYSNLPPEGRFCLTTRMAPAHREQVIEVIRERLDTGKICRVVSTSLIECGVDLDFPYGFRELAGFDSIIQVLGRINRHGDRPRDECKLEVFNPMGSQGKEFVKSISVTRSILSPGELVPNAPDTVRRYFSIYYGLFTKTGFGGKKYFLESNLDCKGIVKSFRENVKGNELPFKSVAERFRMIDTDTQSVYVPIDETASSLIDSIKSGRSDKQAWRKLGRYSVSLYKREFESMLRSGKIQMLDEENAVLIDSTVYDRDIGLRTEDPLDFLTI